MNTPRQLTGVILAGGASRRMGGQDKGLILFRERPLVAWVIDALAPQVDEILIVANRNLEAYRTFGHRVVSDLRPDFPGPLAGFEAALSHARHEWILTCPTDAPHLPANFALLMQASGSATATVGYADAHWQPVFNLLPRTSLASLSASLDAGEHKVQRWLEKLAPTLINLDAVATQLRDADTPEDLAKL